jgi:hypothetical protein
VRYRFLLPLPLVALMGACSLEGAMSPSPDAGAHETPGPGQPGETAIRTDSSRYTLERRPTGWQADIAIEYTNPTDATISLLNCNGAFSLRLEKYDAGEWVTAWQPALPMCLSPPIEIGPGETFSRTLEVFGADPHSQVFPQFQVEEIDGTYRLVIDSAYHEYDHDGPPWGVAVPLEHRVSNTFELRTQ